MVQSTGVVVLGIALSASLLASTARAHHGFGSFDLGTDIELTGVVTDMDFVNPHSWLYLTVTSEDGQVTNWRCEMRAATVLRRSGWSPEMFESGQRITITGSPDRDDPKSCYLGTVIFADGSSMNRYGQREKAAPALSPERELRLANGDLNITGDWAPEQLVMTDPRGQAGTLVPLSTAATFEPGEVPEGARPMPGTRTSPESQIAGLPPATGAPAVAPSAPAPAQVQPTEAGKVAASGFDMWSTDNPRMRCETTSILFDWTFDGPVNRITQGGDTITLQYGQLGFTRTIHMNKLEHPPNIEPSRAGHSIGRWEDDVLIVDTVGFAPGVLSAPIMHGERLHVVERFSFDPQKVAITRTYTAEDPEYFVGPFTGSDTIYVADLPYAPDACDELTFVDYSQEGQARAAAEAAARARGAAGAAAAPPAEAPAAPARPWWKFWD